MRRGSCPALVLERAAREGVVLRSTRTSMQHPHFDAAPALRCGRGPWFKSPYSSGDNCLESARVPRVVPVRDSKLSLTEKTSGPLPTAGLDAIHHEHQGPRTPVYLIPTQSCCPLQSQ
ncbi:DUF397 domain-containing protein [Streptomyces sp. NPDC048156]|uniref:DUF397 domain-containing protein n=1 Tax=Streptomyces sp. NPDC048156 TaxID=3365502 RepID=UPI003713009C